MLFDFIPDSSAGGLGLGCGPSTHSVRGWREGKEKIWGVTRKQGKRIKWHKQASESSTCSCLLISACSTFVFISRYCTAYSSCSKTSLKHNCCPACGHPLWLPLNARLCPGGWRCDVWCHQYVAMLLLHWIPEDESQCGAGSPSGINSLWVLRVKQKNRWLRCLTSSSSSGSRDGTWGHERKTLDVFYSWLAHIQQNYFGFLKFIESTGWIIQAKFWWDEGMVSAEEMIVWNTIFSKSNHTRRSQLHEFCLCIDSTLWKKMQTKVKM